MKQKIDYRILFLQNVYKQFQEFQPFLKNDKATINELGNLLATISTEKGNLLPYLDQLINKLKASRASVITNQYLSEAQSNQTEFNVSSGATSGRAARMALGKMAHHQRQKVNNRVIRKVVTNTSERLLIKLEKTGNVPAFEVKYDFGGKPRIKPILPYVELEESLEYPTNEIHSGEKIVAEETHLEYNNENKPQARQEPSPGNPDRYLTGETKPEVSSGEEFELIVKVSTKAGKERPGYNAAPFRDIEGTLTISVYCPGVEFLNGSTKELQVPPTGDSKDLTFKLKAISSGRHVILITAWKEAAHVAGMNITLNIDLSSGDGSGGSGASNIDPRDPEEGEYTLEVIYEETLKRYRFQLRNKEYGSTKPLYMNMEGERQIKHDQLLNSLNSQAQNLNNQSAKMQANWLKALGRMMTTQLMPVELQNTLWKEKDRIRRLNILCEGNSLPWEILYIDPPDQGEGCFLAETSSIARWRYGPPPPGTIQAKDVYLVHPAGSPAYTKQEIEQLQQQLPGSKIIRTDSELMDVLTEGKFSLLHFASHNYTSTDKTGASFIPFGTTKFELLLMYAVDANKYSATSPLIFMNACTTAGETPLFREMSSWADEYLKRGAGAFIGSLWEVVDQTAPEFSINFYKSLKAGKTLGEAMRDGREAIKTKDEGDPTRFAYTLYGNPQAKLIPV